MSNSLKASTTGLVIVDKARKRLGWTKTSTARWWQDAHTSKATLRRFWQGDRIQQEIFIAICQAVGIDDWQVIADISEVDAADIADTSTPYLDWEEAPDVECFYGRNQELTQLEQWIISDRCKLVTIIGMAGMGKTALALALADRLQLQFEGLIWRSLHPGLSLSCLLDGLLCTFRENPVSDLQQSIAKLIHHLQQHRYLLILDGLDAVWSQPEHQRNYNDFILELNRHRHLSCILLTSREQPNFGEINPKTARHLTIKGLTTNAAIELLQTRGFTGKERGLSTLIHLYRGHPLALKLVTPLIELVFAGNIIAFLSQNTIVIGDRLQGILKQQFEQLGDLEREILYWLAIWQQPVSFSRLQTHLLIAVDPATVLTAIVALERRSLLEKWITIDEPCFTLQPLVMRIVTDELVENAAQEIIQVMQHHDIAHFRILRTHCLIRPGSDDIVGDRILHLLREKLWRLYSINMAPNLERMLLLLNHQSPLAIGYIADNLTMIIGNNQ